MRAHLLASVGVLAIGAGFGPVLAQTAPSEFAPTQGQVAWPLTSKSVATANDNNNAQAAARPGALANPTPGTIVIHIGGRVHTGFKSTWSSVDERFATAPAGSSTTGVVKLEPNAFYSYARLYFGADAMATNGLRYGAAIEIRQNFIGQPPGNTSSNASASSSASTLFVRRAFTYVAGDQWGIVRAGQADGLISLYDNGVTTFQYLPTNNLQNGDDYGSLVPGNASVPFFFLSGAGNEYTVTKFVYLSPQIAGFDFGLQYSPTLSNGYGISTGNPFNGLLTNGTGVSCSVANSGCATLSSGPGANDGSHVVNWTSVGARYQGTLGGVGVLAYAAYGFSGHTQYTGPQIFTPTGAINSNGTTNLGVSSLVVGTGASARYIGSYNGTFQGLSYGNGGVAVTYAGFTIGANVIGGRINGQLGLVPQHGVSEIAYMVGAKYVYGPFVIGIAAERGDYQGSVNLAGLSQRRGQAIDVGVGYTVAPGFSVYAEYQYNTLYQGGFNFVTSGIGSNANNTATSQGILLGNVVNF
jgi:hypothetical protein